MRHLSGILLALAMLCLTVSLVPSEVALAGIHRAPIIVPSFKIRQASRYPISVYRLYRTGPDGKAIQIPFQIDEINQWGDYVLDYGPTPNSDTGNGIFDSYDELSFMGDDVGPYQKPTSWPAGQPSTVYEIHIKRRGAKPGKTNEGAVYIGIHLANSPDLVDQKYVVYDAKNAHVTTSRYQYRFDKRNYLVVDGVDMFLPDAKTEAERIPIIDSSTFYMAADLKYFLTFIANHRSIDSKLEAYKSGPVRTIVRVTFVYTFLKLNFEVGMYTEVSFFTNSVILPAIIYNPLDGKDSLNSGSNFYYGFALHDKLSNYKIDTNIRPYQGEKGLLDIFRSTPKVEKKYWITLTGNDRMIYVELEPSKQMLKEDNVPYFYQKDADGPMLSKIDNNQPHAIAKSPINIGLYFDLTKFKEGEHLMSFQLFFENKKDLEQLDDFKNLGRWNLNLKRL